MQYKIFGRRTGLRVSELAFGAGNFGTGWGHGADQDEARRMFDGYVEAGGNFIDTANSYQAGQSEVISGQFIGPGRDNFVLSTKYSLGTAGEGINFTGNSRKNMIRSVEASLKRLNTDRIDILWAHMDDGVTPIDEILRGFDDLVRSGKILYAGLSNFPAWRISYGALLADLRNWAPLAGIQVEYSLVERSAERELLPMAEALGLGVTAWSPLGGGFLTGKYRQSDEGRAKALGMLVHSEKSAHETAVLDAVLALASQLEISPTHVAIAWLMARAKRSQTTIIPILGSRTRAQLDATLGALAVNLSDAQIEALDKAAAISPGVPHNQLISSATRLAGGDPNLLQKPRLTVC